ncbi:MAG TPA: hypothetical protein VI588_02090 [Candidatus Gracilibacteria bacterium]|nr:hypothetical protein [Candidatus Gracilibacteria bacterium]
MAVAVKTDKNRHHKAQRIIRNVYLYIVSMIGLIVFIWGAVSIINTVLKTYVFQVDDYTYYSPFMEGPCEMQQIDPKDPTGKTMIEHTTQEIAECEEKIEEQRVRDRTRNLGYDVSIGVAQIAVGAPVWLFHWGIIKREYRRKEDEKE